MAKELQHSLRKEISAFLLFQGALARCWLIVWIASVFCAVDLKQEVASRHAAEHEAQNKVRFVSVNPPFRAHAQI
jgi:hypothetical protein